MRVYFIILLVVFSGITVSSQQAVIDSFAQLISPPVADSFRQLLLQNKIPEKDRVRAFHLLSYNVLFSKPDSAMHLAEQGKRLAREIKYPEGEVLCDAAIGSFWWIIGDYTKANEIFLKCLQSSERLKDTLSMVWSLAWLASAHRDEGNYGEAIKYCRKGMAIPEKPERWSAKIWNSVMGSIYQAMDLPDTALIYLLKGDVDDGYSQVITAHTYALLKNDAMALQHYRKSIPLLSSDNNLKDLADAYKGLAHLSERQNETDSAIYYASIGFTIAQAASFKKWVFETSLILSRLYERKDVHQSLRYYKIAMAAKDSIFNFQKAAASLHARYNEQLNQRAVEAANIRFQNKIRTYFLIAVVGFFLVLAIILYRNNVHKERAKEKIEKAYRDLEATQAQLIQSEKMASLGELTTGIAHEIQNPLNFVNNFSEVNKELLAEMKDEIDKGNLKEVKTLANDVIENQEKINQHGKRADAIVKGMLQHSRVSSGQKELIDINALVDEYLRLAYHGLRAKDKTFNAKFETNLDPVVGKINIVPQEIGRVILNLINNAFYAVSEKQKLSIPGYEPIVTIGTKKRNGKIEIIIRDNGIGIPEKLMDKIFQPFFTTKPTGQGTGLGLSLAYDIVKANSGEITVTTSEGKGAEFTILLPCSFV